MNKFLTESGWKAILQKFKIKDNGLQGALAGYEKLAEDKYPERLKALAQVIQLAGNLKKSKECMSQPDVVKYLAEVVKAAEAERKSVEAAAAKAKAAADAKVAADAKAEATPPKPDPKMLEEVFQMGHHDGLDGVPSRSQLFAKVPDFQKKYDEGYKLGVKVAKMNRDRPPPPSNAPVMKPISKGEWDRSVEYTKRKQARKQFIQYLNKWWGTRLPEDL